MRNSQEYKALLAQINVQKELYSQQEALVNDELEQKIQYTVEKVKKFNVLFVIVFALMLVFIGIIYEFFIYYNIKHYIIYVIFGMIEGLGVILGFEITYRIKLRNLNIQKDMEYNEKNIIRAKIRELNDLISSLVISIITMNEHFYELSNIKNEEELLLKWNQYTNEVIMAINKKYSYNVTYSEYQEYLKEYEEDYEKRIKNNE